MFGNDENRAAPSSSDTALTFTTPVRFDAELIPRLLVATGSLNSHFAAMLCRLEDDADASIAALTNCADELHALRQTEALWLYPVIARSVEVDHHARRQLAHLRLTMLTLARRALRRFEDLLQALRNGENVAAAAENATAAWSDYLRRNQSEIYPLYEIAGRQRETGARAA